MKHWSVFRLGVAALCLSFSACDCGAAKITNTFDAGCREEVCNGVDDDCNGLVDDNLPVLSCGLGACARTLSSCVDGVVQSCEAGTPSTETCNGLDDDCNGEVDDNIEPVVCGVGECATTVSACVDGVTQSCVPGEPATERCDGRDNDCDGQVDEDIAAATCGEGACARTVVACLSGVEQVCEPGLPGTELCDGVDNNCDGQVDEGVPALTCGVGDCARTVAACVNGAGQVCTPGAPAAEVCDGRDNDCDGALDNGLGLVSCGLGACRRTVASCVSGTPQACVPGTPTQDVCDGVDNDCNGVIDDNGVCNPPIVFCSASQNGSLGSDFTLSATATDIDGTIVTNAWIVVVRPTGSTTVPTPTNQTSTTFHPDVEGSYTLAFCATDNAGTRTCCSTSVSTTACPPLPTPAVAPAACGTSWDGRPIVQLSAPVPVGQVYQLRLPGQTNVLASAGAGENYMRPPLRVAPGGPPPGVDATLEVRACTASDLACCSAATSVPSVKIVEACTTPVPPTSSNLVISEYVTNGGGPCPGGSCQAGEAVELTNLSHCPVSLDGFHFAYRNPSSASGSFRWMNFGPTEIVPPRGTYVAIRGLQSEAPSCWASISQTPATTGLFGLRISSLEMQGQLLDNGWFNNSGGGTSVMQVAPGVVADAGVPDFMMPVAQVAPYVGGTNACVGVGFNALGQCGDFPGSVTPTTQVSPNQLGRLWHPCDVLGSTAVPACVRN